MEKLIEAQHLYKSYARHITSDAEYVLRDISLQIYKGESVGLVGESGCGKTTLGKCLLRLESISKGELFFHGEAITKLAHKNMLPYRQRMQMVFQSSYDSFDPYYDVRQILTEPLLHTARQDAYRRNAPMCKVRRPQWDLEKLAQLNWTRLRCDFNITQKIWPKEKQIRFRSTPMFVIVCEK